MGPEKTNKWHCEDDLANINLQKNVKFNLGIFSGLKEMRIRYIFVNILYINYIFI
jgi:hypothetical protein